ncbi:hypothetical protein AMECASPLE_000566 [Ameca splendens]|uniref:Secreted protein n=1 Tax=Ameca splendens TaxID=208324 RepID=A0ABV0XA54_9TELE
MLSLMVLLAVVCSQTGSSASASGCLLLEVMHLHVVFERRAEREGLPADRASLRPLARVLPHVDLHVRAGGEGLVADVAAEGFLPGVRPQVADHGRGVDEALPADPADERLLAGVRARMHVQVQAASEGFPAELADVDLEVRLQVLQQHLLVNLQLTADAVLIISMDLSMVPQRAMVAEHHPSDPARNGTTAGVFF